MKRKTPQFISTLSQLKSAIHKWDSNSQDKDSQTSEATESDQMKVSPGTRALLAQLKQQMDELSK